MSMGVRIKVRSLGLVVLAVLLLLSLMLPSMKVAAETKGDFKIIGYYTSWSPPTNLDANQVTHLNYAFADVCWDGIHGNPEVWVPEGESNTWPCRGQGEEVLDVPNGTVVLGDPENDTDTLFEGDTEEQDFAGNLNQLRKLKQTNPNLKTLISIGGWSWSNNLSLVAATQETREVFAKSAVEFIRTYEMDGVDLDWEYPVSGGMWNNHRSPDDKVNHTLLLQEIRNALDEAEQEDGREYLLTIASSVSFAYLENNELDKIAEIVDFINIMTYDFNGAWAQKTGHNAPLFKDDRATEADVHPHNIEAGITGHLTHGVPKEKLVMGLPFYGRSWGGCNQDNNFEKIDNGGYQQCTGPGIGNLEPGVYTYSYIQENLLNQNGYTRYWNDVAKVPYLYNQEIGEFVSYDDPESLTHKVNFIKDTGLAGAMIWELSQDDNNAILLTTINEELSRTNSTPPDGDDGDDGGDDGTGGDDGNDGGTGGDDGSGDDDSGDDGTRDDDKDDDDDSDDNGKGNDTPTHETPGDRANDDVDKKEETPPVKKDGGSKGDGQKLPSTATNLFNWLLAGLLLIGAGTSLYYYRKKTAIS
ncbi:glycoside hydrolase family 18 protein [Bacillus alkalicellulosilyticus]|uniref:glycoside hydrolase family 18 protein n=1 Tax=Alkalihalobacterium alkalicellulosilyticum TaxID=1912214 RepID=UPI0009984A0F|nr:glycoside hydrolase family 18 protein [Bacillus alkalicellulosilyticus]